MSALIMLAMLQVPDTLVVRVPLPTTEPVAVTAPPVSVNVEIHADSLAAVYARGAEAAERAVAVHLANDGAAQDGCGCGVPGWFYAGALVIGAAAVSALWYHVVKTHGTRDIEDDEWIDGEITDTGGPDRPFGPLHPAETPSTHPHGHQPGNSGHGKGRGKKP